MNGTLTTTQPTVWRTIGFSAAGSGWRLVYLDAESPYGYDFAPLPGWLIQEACDADPITDAPVPRLLSQTRVIAAGADTSGLLEPADLAFNFWQVLPPGAPSPAFADAKAEREARRSIRELDQEQGTY